MSRVPVNIPAVAVALLMRSVRVKVLVLLRAMVLGSVVGVNSSLSPYVSSLYATPMGYPLPALQARVPVRTTALLVNLNVNEGLRSYADCLY